MADGKPEAEKKPAGPMANTPEGDAASRVKTLKETIKRMESEIKILEGQAKNRDPNLVLALEAENHGLNKRIQRLQKSLLFLVLDVSTPRQPAEFKDKLDVLRTAAVEYCKKANINLEIWKNIAF